MLEYNKKRVFIAINPPNSIKNEVKELINELKGNNRNIKWVNSEDAHLTLVFLGNIDLNQINNVKLIIQSVVSKFTAFDFQIERMNAFPSMANPRIIFLDCSQTNGKSIIKLQKIITEKLIESGFRCDLKSWRPHITIGRAKETVKMPILNRNFKLNNFTAESIDLMESNLTEEGATYSILDTCKLN